MWTVIRQGRASSTSIGETLPDGIRRRSRKSTLDTFDVIRIERGVPRFLADMDEDTIPLEAGIEDRAISFTKGCYVGQEVIVRVTTRGGGRVAKKLVRWVADASADIVPLPRLVVDLRSFEQGHRPRDERRLLADVNRVVGLGYVHRDFTASGTEVTVMWNDSRVKAVVQ